MKRWVCLGTVTAILVGMALAKDRAGAQGDKPPSVKEIMGKLHKGSAALRPSLDKTLQADEPAWNEIQRQTKEFAQLAEALPKNDPPKGDRDSWIKHTKGFAENAQKMNEAAQKKDKQAAKASFVALGGQTCSACHNVHRRSAGS